MTRDRIGANRLDILLDAYEMAGRLTPQMKNVIRALSALGDEDEDESDDSDGFDDMDSESGSVTSNQTSVSGSHSNANSLVSGGTDGSNGLAYDEGTEILLSHICRGNDVSDISETELQSSASSKNSSFEK